MNIEKDDHDGSSSHIIDYSKMSLNNYTLKELYSLWHEGGEDDVEVAEKIELDVYLYAPHERLDGTDILKWCKRQTNTYKVLAEMAKHILAVSVSTVSSESAFSTPSRVLDQFCSSLGSQNSENLDFPQDWLSAFTICIDVENL